MKYSTNDLLVKNNIIVSWNEVDFWVWFHFDYSMHFKALETITPYLSEIGIKRTDRVLSLPDESINISLYLMDQKGYTSYRFNHLPY